MTEAAGASREADVAVPGGGRVHVRWWRARRADPRRPVLLALHGWTDSGEDYESVAQVLRQRWHVVAPDAPGHGGTAWGGGDRADVTDHVRFADAALRAVPRLLGLREPGPAVVLLGHSMGGLTAARLSAARAHDARAGATPVALVLEDPAGTAPRRLPTSASGRAWIPALRRLDEAALVERSRELNGDWSETDHRTWARSLKSFDESTLDVPLTWGPPLVEALAECPLPVTLVVGRASRGGIVSTRAAMVAAAACRSGAEVHVLDAGHSVRREARELFLSLVAGVLGSAENHAQQ